MYLNMLEWRPLRDQLKPIADYYKLTLKKSYLPNFVSNNLKIGQIRAQNENKISTIALLLYVPLLFGQPVYITRCKNLFTE